MTRFVVDTTAVLHLVNAATRCSGGGPGTWRIGWDGASTYNAEYVALTQLQADAFITLGAELARGIEGSSPRRRLTRCAGNAHPVSNGPQLEPPRR